MKTTLFGVGLLFGIIAAVQAQNLCTPNPCVNSGACFVDPLNDEFGYICICPEGFKGQNCQEDLCTPNPCVNNGACFVDPLNDEFGYICICPEGFIGQNCQEETNECDPNPCQNDGNCTDGFLTFSCECPPGFNGEECEFGTNECDPNPCQNDGNCTDGFLTFSCECPPGFNGEECEFEINECDSNPCQNGGTCSDGILTFSCECPLGLNGHECQFDLLALSFPPVLVTATATSLTTKWNAWDPNIDRGDPPVVAYIPYYREALSEEWISGPVTSSGETLEFEVNNLEADTLYEFSITAVREGENGQGAKSPSATLRTKCDVSLEKTPDDVKAILNITIQQLNISWQSPNNIRCSSGISFYSVYYSDERSNDGVQFLARAEADVRWIIIDIELLGEGEFSFFVSLTVESESNLSSGSEKIVIKEDMQGEPSSSGPSFIVIFIIIIIIVVVVSICIFLVVRYQRKRRSKSNSSSSNTERAGYDNKAVL